MPIIGVARSGDLASLRDRARQSLAASGAVDPAATDKLLAQLRYVKGSDDDADTFQALRRELGAAVHPLHYLAIPPSLFTPVIGGLELFAREDAVEAAWRVVDGGLGVTDPVREYEPGSWGPAEADRVLEPGGHWHDPTVPRPTEPARAAGR